MRASLLLLFCLGACDVAEPIDPATLASCAELAAQPRMAGDRRFDRAADMAWSLWGAPGERFPVTVIAGEHLATGDNGAWLDGKTCGTVERGRIYLALRSPNPSGTSLAHELLHLVLARTAGDADHYHEAPEWGDPLDAINAALAEAGL